MNPTSKSKKRKFSGKSTNPLAEARGKDTADAIWFRKTGAGYHCFVEYYTGQPTQTVTHEEDGSPPTNSNAKIQPVVADDQRTDGTCGGLSRAAKRRQKKRQRNGDTGTQSTNTDGKTSQQPTIVKPTNSLIMNEDELHDPPLLKASKGFARRQFFDSMSKPLPLTFRIRLTADPETVREFQSELDECSEGTIHSTKISLYKYESAQVTPSCYQGTLNKGSLNAVTKELLLDYSQNGTIARQELGSMLPVAVLQRSGALEKKGLKCLDMCASPGSKTLQLLEVLLSIRGTSTSNNYLLVANDILKSRLEALQSAVERSGMKGIASITYTCQDATKFELRQAVSTASLLTSESKISHSAVNFDSIICDVPCSGDGTCRKDKHILPQWNPSIGNELHKTQLSILSRAVELLKPGGYVCYSTCSLNPVEDEAVIAAVLQKFNNNGKATIKIAKCPEIPGVTLRDGVSNWKVATYDSASTTDEDDDDIPTISNTDNEERKGRLLWYKTYDDAIQKTNDPKVWSASMWPPSSKVVSEMKLSRCKRLRPQDNDSGGFFLCLLQKMKNEQ